MNVVKVSPHWPEVYSQLSITKRVESVQYNLLSENIECVCINRGIKHDFLNINMRKIPRFSTALKDHCECLVHRLVPLCDGKAVSRDCKLHRFVIRTYYQWILHGLKYRANLK